MNVARWSLEKTRDKLRRTFKNRHGGEVVTQESAKLPHAGSIPARASRRPIFILRSGDEGQFPSAPQEFEVIKKGVIDLYGAKVSKCGN